MDAQYLFGAWLAVQVAAMLLPVFDTPARLMKVLVVVLAFGFFISMAQSPGLDTRREHPSIRATCRWQRRMLSGSNRPRREQRILRFPWSAAA